MFSWSITKYKPVSRSVVPWMKGRPGSLEEGSFDIAYILYLKSSQHFLKGPIAIYQGGKLKTGKWPLFWRITGYWSHNWLISIKPKCRCASLVREGAYRCQVIRSFDLYMSGSMGPWINSVIISPVWECIVGEGILINWQSPQISFLTDEMVAVLLRKA